MADATSGTLQKLGILGSFHVPMALVTMPHDPYSMGAFSVLVTTLFLDTIKKPGPGVEFDEREEQASIKRLTSTSYTNRSVRVGMCLACLAGGLRCVSRSSEAPLSIWSAVDFVRLLLACGYGSLWAVSGYYGQ